MCSIVDTHYGGNPKGPKVWCHVLTFTFTLSRRLYWLSCAALL